MTATNRCSNFVGFRYSPPLYRSSLLVMSVVYDDVIGIS